MKTAKMQYCAYCGKELGVYIASNNHNDTCGDRECERWNRDEQIRDAMRHMNAWIATWVGDEQKTPPRDLPMRPSAIPTSS